MGSRGRILGVMTTSTSARRRLSSSPFQPEPEPVVEEFAFDELVSHDLYGLGRVISVEADAVTVDFRPDVVRIVRPFKKLSKL